MNLTENTETEVLKVYDTWLHSYLNGDVTTYTKYLDKDYHFIGSTANEEFLNKKATTTFFENTADQLAGKCDLRNETKIVEKFEGLVFITHLFDAWFLNGEEYNFYGRFRFSNALKKNKEGWRFIYQHYSVPDAKAEEGESIGFEKISAENLQLREAISRRTKELEEKNRELEVEGALERIRAQAVAMKESTDLLDIVVTMRNEFTKLGHEAHYFWHMMWQPNTYEKAMTSGDGTKIGFVMQLPRHIHGDITQLATWEKSKKSTVVYAMNAEEALAYVHKMVSLGDFKNIDPQAPTEKDIREIGGLTFIMARTSHGEIGYSLPGVVKNPPKEDIDILVKFAGAFDLAHQRFLDLQKAENQTRETQIELALEKVRSRTMAMQKSVELNETAELMFAQIKKLGIELWSCGFSLWYDDDSYFIGYNPGPDGKMGNPLTIPLTEDIFFKTIRKSKRKGEDFLVFESQGEALKKTYQYMDTLPVVGETMRGFVEAGFTLPTYQVTHCGFFEDGHLMFITEESIPENVQIFKRFTKVFNQTYTRFLDLKKAEAQAKEAKIETALEKVRSRSLAMQNSDELKELIGTVYKELNSLDMALDRCLIWIMNDEDYSTRLWMANREAEPVSFYVPNHKNPPYRAVIKGWKERNTDWEYHLKGKIKQEWDQFVFENTEMKHFPEKLKKMMKASKHTVMSGSFHSFGCLQTAGPKSLNEEQSSILTRFATVFNQAYTRFLDLQKAESQAKEAQIEAALERVRSRSMAMYNSSEIGDVAFVLFQQLKSLGGEFWGTGFAFCKEDSKVDEFWFANENGIMPHLKIPNTKDPVHKKMYQGWKKNLETFSIAKGGKGLIEHYKYMLTVPDVQPIFQGMLDNGISFPEWQKWHAAYFKYGYLLAITTETYEGEGVFVRFAKVFEQAYTRFLDLQKAEAQAREAQIENALERVRSQSMGMQTSEDLSNVTTEMFKQLRQFGGDLFATGIVFCDKHKDHIEQWHSIPNAGMMSPFIVPIDLDYIHQYRYDEWKKGTELFSVEIPSGFIDQHFKDIFNLPSAQKVLKDLEDQNTPMPEAPPWEIDYGASFKHGYILVSSLQYFEEAEILPRFAKVFEQAYTRFLDLQKSEAQAREAQIEHALEKVRSRTMAMQHSDELPDAANVLFTEVQNLGIPAWSCGYNILSEDKKMSTCIMSSEGEIQSPFVLPLTEHKSLKPWHKSILNNEEFFVYEQGGKELEAHYEYMQSLPELKKTFQQFKDAEIPLPTFQVNHLAKFTNGFLLFITYERVPKAHDIFKRFATVFQQTYTRFIDLKKAEEQTRKAQIETSLERVRARAMAMHDSNELDEVLSVLCEQFDVLGIVPMSTHMTVFDFENNTFTFRETGKFGNRSFGEQTVALDAMDNWKETVDKWKADKATAINKLHFPKKQLKEVWEVFHESFASMPEGSRITPKDYPDGIYHTAGKHPFGYIGMNQVRPPTKEEEQIVIKFANEFGMAYQRFLDLKKAEAQTREAQIEAALEKVRSRSLAMHTTDELQEIVALVAEKLRDLGVIFDAGGVILCTYFPDNRDVMHWIAAEDFSYSGNYLVPYFENPIFDDAWESKSRGDDYFSKEFSVEDKNDFFEYAFEHSDYKHFPDEFKQHALEAENHRLTAAWSKNSAIIIPSFTEATPSESDADILKRFATVFEQAYIRFMDLKKAEKRTRETQIDIALERVRSRAMAMHQSDELSEAAELLYQEFSKLGVTPFSCGYLINDEDNKQWKVWMTDANDASFKNFWTLPFKADKHLKKRHESWKNKEAFHSTELAGKENKNHHKIIARYAPWKKDSIGQLPKKLVLSSAHFTHGHLLIVTGETLTQEEESILTRFATVFDQTYIRFLDLKRAEHQALLIKEEKERLEITLKDLQTTQKQLIQSEKMASLGELTAGIAHEIQNPLNFVNNFSEVSKELLDEMLEELEKGDMEEVKAIMDDVIQNLDKINHHGKRADGIVKGMLQHSRASGDKKELTDINALADEYMRLAYHGLRAKDKSFNASLETAYDESIKKIKVIPQDIGRVILNLFTNAFYAVDEKKKTGEKEYKPTVSVSTKNLKSKIELTVKDNGNGIPKHIITKIFQPFFTTKPTGKGTGLGLSMSYDIITKGHEGELKVETKPGEGTTFIILIPTKE